MGMRIVETLTNAFMPDVRVYKEAVYLVGKGYHVTILCWDREIESDMPKTEIVDGIEIVRFRHVCPAGQKKGKLYNYLKYIRSCRKYLLHNECDYLHCNDISGAIVGLFARHRHTPMVVDMHEFFESGSYIKRKLMHWLLVYVFKKSKAGLYENAAYLDDSYASVRDRLYPLRNYPDSKMVEYIPKTQSDELRVGFHGWIRKNMFSIKALFEVCDEIDGLRVDINGCGPGHDQVSEWAKGKKNVFVHGAFDGTKMMSALYANTDITFCGYDKNDPNYQGDAEVVKYYESIRTGTPMIMTAGIGMGDKVEKMGFGISCDTYDKGSIRTALVRFLTDRQFYDKCVSNELKVASKYCWEDAVRILDKIYS